MATARKPIFRPPSTPAGAIAAAAVAGVVAIILLFTALSSDDGNKESSGPAAPVKVIVANRLIPKGSTAEAISGGTATRATSVDANSLQSGAITDISQIRGKVTSRDILAGQQLTTGDFDTIDTKTLVGQLTRDFRAVSITLDAAHGMIGQAKEGDRVDVFASFAVGTGGGPDSAALKPLATNLLVLKTPDEPNATANVVTIRMSSRQSAKVAFTADFGKLWIVLRPPAGAPGVNNSLVTLTNVLGGSAFINKLKADAGSTSADTSSDTGAVANSGKRKTSTSNPSSTGVSNPATDPTDPGTP